MNGMYLRGELYFADLGEGIGSEQQGIRPVLIIQNDVGNRHSPTVIAAAVTSRRENRVKLPTHHEIGSCYGLGRPSTVLLEQIRTLDKTRLKEYIGRIEPVEMKEIDCCIAVSLGLNTSCKN